MGGEGEGEEKGRRRWEGREERDGRVLEGGMIRCE